VGSGLLAKADKGTTGLRDSDVFIGTVALDIDESLVIHVAERQGKQWMHFQYWSCKVGDWQPDGEEFLVPMRKARYFLAGVTAAIENKPITNRPEWLNG